MSDFRSRGAVTPPRAQTGFTAFPPSHLGNTLPHPRHSPVHSQCSTQQPATLNHNVGEAGDWEDNTPLERQKEQEFYSFVFKEPLISRVQRFSLWPLDKVHEALVEYMRLLILKDEMDDFEGRHVLVPPLISLVWECHLIDTREYRSGLGKISGEGIFFDHSPDFPSSLNEEIKAEKISQMQLYYKGKFGRDPHPFFCSFNSQPNSGIASAIGRFIPPMSPRIEASTMPPLAPTSRRPYHATSTIGPDQIANNASAPINPNALYPSGSGRFSRDVGGITRLTKLPSRISSPHQRLASDEGTELGKKESPSKALTSPARRRQLPMLQSLIDDYGKDNTTNGESNVNRINEDLAETSPQSQVPISNGSGGCDGADAGSKEPEAVQAAIGSIVPEMAVEEPRTPSTITFTIKCREPIRFRHVMTVSKDTNIASLRAMIKREMGEALATADFSLFVLGSRIDENEWSTLGSLNILDGDIITITTGVP